MGILVGEETRAIVQGITGTQGSFQTKLMINYGTKIVAGVTPGKGGTKFSGFFLSCPYVAFGKWLWLRSS